MEHKAFKNGKKILSLALVAALSVATLTGCQKDTGVSDKEGRTVISVGNWPDKDGADKDMMDKRKSEFEKANPDFVIRPDSWAFDIKTFYAKAAGGQLPTVYGTNFTEVPQIIGAGYSADLTKALKEEKLYDKFNTQVLDLVKSDGKVWAFPYAAYVLGMSANIDMMKAAGLVDENETPKQPKTWDEVTEFAVKIKEATGKPGFVFPTANHTGGWIFTAVAWSYGAKFMKQNDDKTWTATFNSPEAAAALQWIKDLKWKYDVLPSNTLIDSTEYYKLLGTEGVGMLITAGDVPKRLIQYGMDINKIGMLAMPAGPKRHVTLMGGGVYAVSNKATEKQVQGAVKWINSVSSPYVSDDFKTNYITEFDLALSKGQLMTIKSLSPWNASSESVSFVNNYIDEHANSNPNHVKLYNDFVDDLGTCELQAEEPVCAQELYGVLDTCIQKVLTDKNADPASLLQKACNDFQVNYLDNLDY